MTAPVTAPEARIENLRVSTLTVDHVVQRTLDRPRVDRMASEFNPAALGTIVVSLRRDGTRHIIDGQHRVAMLLALGYEQWEIPCEVHRNLTTQQEAAMFRLLNNTRAVNVLEKFLVRIQEGDPVATAINDVIVDKGWRVAQAKQPGTFVAVSALEKAYRRGGERGVELVGWILDTVTKSWGFDADGVRAEIVTGLAMLWLRHGDAVDQRKLIDELTVLPGGARGLVGRARSLKDFRRGTIGDAAAEVLVNLVNSKRRVNRLPSWREDVSVTATTVPAPPPGREGDPETPETPENENPANRVPAAAAAAVANAG